MDRQGQNEMHCLQIFHPLLLNIVSVLCRKAKQGENYTSPSIWKCGASWKGFRWCVVPQSQLQLHIFHMFTLHLGSAEGVEFHTWLRLNNRLRVHQIALVCWKWIGVNQVIFPPPCCGSMFIGSIGFSVWLGALQNVLSDLLVPFFQVQEAAVEKRATDFC